ncbi:MAG TPA: OmpA family protein [Vicinamibacterales bacterium]|nr:OmpA family protein [Vicinamibacterales bacterium]
MTPFRYRCLPAAIVLLLVSVPALAQEPGVDEENCKPSPLMTRMPGCGIYECSKKEFDAFEVVVNKAGEMKNLEGEVDHLKLVCPANLSPLQLLRNAEAALKKSGFTVVHSGRHEAHDHPAVTAQKGAQWIQVQTSMFNEFPTYEQTGVLVKAMTQEMTASAQAMSDAIAKSGRLDVYGITFATGQAAITPQSDQVLSDVLAVLTANADWRLRIEGHTDNVGDKAANMKLSQARAAAVASWLTAKGIDAGRLSTAGLGDTQPVADNASEDGRARNRRVVLIKQ